MRWARKAFAVAGVALVASLISTDADARRLSGERSLSTTKWGYQIVKSPVRAGKRAQRFEVRPGDCSGDSGWSDCDNDRERSEITLKKDWRYGTTQWIGFSVYVPQDFKASSKVNTTVGQIHQRGGPSGTAGGLPSFPPLMQLEMRGGSYIAGVHILTGSASNVRDNVKKFPLASINAMRGKWTDILIHLDTAKGKEVLEVYVNGQRKAALTDFINFIPKEFYFKYGIYRSFVSRHGGPMPTQILYIDEVKLGKSADKVRVNEARPMD
jgi:hypothetical protein